jgi:bud site selection protein 20
MDNIFEDLKPENLKKIKSQPSNPELPGFGQNYCVHVFSINQCARHFITKEALLDHEKTKLHKKRVKMLENGEAYTQKEAELAAGLGTDNGRQ